MTSRLPVAIATVISIGNPWLARPQVLPHGNPEARPRPVAHWAFDHIEDGLVPDLAGQHPGRLLGDPLPEIVPGISGKALRFKRGKGQQVSVEGIQELPLARQMTLMAWVWADNNPYRGDIVGYVSEQNEHEPRPLRGFRLTMMCDCRSVQFQIGDGSKRVLSCGTVGDLRPMAHHWMHVAATYDGETMRIYVNAVERGSFAVDTKIAMTAWALRIGGYMKSPAILPFHGIVDEVRLYDTALSQDQILRAAAEALGA